jgi:hypothetical protein
MELPQSRLKRGQRVCDTALSRPRAFCGRPMRTASFDARTLGGKSDAIDRPTGEEKTKPLQDGLPVLAPEGPALAVSGSYSLSRSWFRMVQRRPFTFT